MIKSNHYRAEVIGLHPIVFIKKKKKRLNERVLTTQVIVQNDLGNL